jgi:subfamily B ATP-binding cassette protein MsbA
MNSRGHSHLKHNDAGVSNGLNFRLLWELIWGPIAANRKNGIAMALALLILSASESLFILLMGPLMTAFLGMSPSETSIQAAKVFPKSLRSFFPTLDTMSFPADQFALWIPVLILGSGLGIGMGAYLYQVNQAALSLLVAKNYRLKLFAAILSLKFRDIGQKSPSEWMSVVMNDVQFLQSRISDILNSMVRDSVKILSAVAMLFVVNWPTALVVTFGSPMIAFGMGKIGKKIALYSEQFQKDLGRMASTVLDIRQRFPFIRAQQGEAFELAGFDRINASYYSRIRDSILIRSAFAPSLEFIGFAFFSLVIMCVNRGWFQGSLNASTIFTFLLALALIVKPLGSIGEQVGKFHETMGVLKGSLAIFEKVQAEGSESFVPRDKASDESFEINEIAISYGAAPAFQAQGLKIPQGSSIAIVGPSGSGKSSLLKCLAGLVEPTTWVSKTPWSQVVATSNLVSQSPFLFTATIRDNILYGLGDDSVIRDKDILEAIEFVGLSDFMRLLPGGLDAEVSAISANLSGGQTQRLVIARALLRNRRLILLDEATSAVDLKNEREIVLRTIALAKERGATVIAVTHRLQWLPEYDQGWFIENGAMVCSGPHVELLRQKRYGEFIGQLSKPS